MNNMQSNEIVEYLTRKTRIIRSADGDEETHEISINLPKFIVNSELSTIKLVWDEGPSTVSLEGGISRLINNSESSTIQVNRDYRFPNNLNLINYILVFTDFIENQYFGDVTSPILKIVPVKSHEDKQLVSFFNNLHYVTVRTSLLNSINITLRDMKGNKIQFEDPFMFVIVKLHFRKLE